MAASAFWGQKMRLFKCAKCDGVKLLKLCWVGANDKKVIEDRAKISKFGRWCNDCQKHVDFIQEKIGFDPGDIVVYEHVNGSASERFLGAVCKVKNERIVGYYEPSAKLTEKHLLYDIMFSDGFTSIDISASELRLATDDETLMYYAHGSFYKKEQ
jgi:hypothetical protein